MGNQTQTASPLVVQNSGRWLGNDGSWSTFYVHIGTPPQHFHVLPSFDGQTIYVPVDEDCLPGGFDIPNCGASRGVEVFASKPGVGFQRNASSTWDQIGTYRVGVGNEHGLTGNAYFGYDTVGPSTSSTIGVPTLNRHAVAAYASADFWQGRLGLSLYPLNMSATDQPHSFLSRLKEEGHIPSLSFGYQAGAPYRFTKIAGSLVLGGYDRSRASNDKLLLSSSQNVLVGLQGISSMFSNGTTTTLLDRGFIAALDADVPELWLPLALCDTIASTFGLIYHKETDRYIQTEATRSMLLDATSVLSFTLGASSSGGRTIEIEIPFNAFDLQASYPIFATPTNYFPLRRAANASQITLGRTFLQEVYISADWERDVFNISQALFMPTMPEPDIVTILPKSEGEGLIRVADPAPGTKSKLSPALIGGISAGAAVLLALFCGLGLWYFLRKRNAKQGNTEVGGMLATNEKSREYYYAPEVAGKSLEYESTHLELEGRVVGELAATDEPDHTQHELRKATYKSDAVELDCVEPVFELPSHSVER